MMCSKAINEILDAYKDPSNYKWITTIETINGVEINVHRCTYIGKLYDFFRKSNNEETGILGIENNSI